eukprot:8659838-Alexandrium_andersonii.AAC.1
MKDSVEDSYELSMSPGHFLVPWLIRHSAWTCARYQLQAGGRSAYYATHGREFRDTVVPFAETCVFKHSGPHLRKFDINWSMG